MKRTIAVGLALTCLMGLTACGKSDEVKAVEAAISAIGEVTLESEAQIDSVWDDYLSLSEEDQEKVDNYDVLVDADAALADAKVEQVEYAIENAAKHYISADEVLTAQEAYDNLDEELQDKVSNYADLVEAWGNYKLSDYQSAMDMTDRFRVETSEDGSTTFYLSPRMPEKDWERSYFLPYVGHDAGGGYMALRFNFAGDWIDFDTATVDADGQSYIMHLNSGDWQRYENNGVRHQTLNYVSEDNASMHTEPLDCLMYIFGADEVSVTFSADSGEAYTMEMDIDDIIAVQDMVMFYQLLIGDPS